MDRSNAFFVGAMSAAIEAAPCFDAVPNDFASAMFALGRQCVYGAFEAVEVMRDPVYQDFNRLVVFIAATFTTVHKILS